MKIFSFKLLITLIYGCFLISKGAAVGTPASFPNLASSQCATPQVKTSSELDIPTGTKQLCITQVVKMDNICSQGPDLTFFRIQAKYDGITLKTIFELKWQSSDNSLIMYAADSSGTVTNLLIDNLEQQATQNAISYYACVDLWIYSAYGGLNTQKFSGTALETITDFTSLSSFDDAVFSFCHDGTNSANCDFSNTIIYYYQGPFYFPTPYLWGINRKLVSHFLTNSSKATLIRSYEVNENTGTTLVDSISHQDATLGSNAPSWSKTNYGLEFTSTNQYISIPAFLPSPADSVVASSFTISMWIRFQTLPSARSYIFRHSNSDLSKDLFAIKVNSHGKVFAIVGSSFSFEFDYSIILNQWSHSSTSLTVKADYKTFFTSMQVNNDFVEPPSISTLTTPLSYSTNDKILIGGTPGVTVYKIQIYSPGSHVFSVDGPVALIFGIKSLPFFFDCDGSCDTCSGSGSSDCLSCSTTSNALFNSTCQTCPSGTAKSDTLCSSCPDNCLSCSSINSCDVCSAGYTLTKNKVCASGFVPNSIAATNGGRTSTDATIQVATVAGNGDSSGVQAQVSGRIFIVIQYFNITYSQDVLTILNNTAATPGEGDPKYVPDAPNSIKTRITERKVPSVFEKYGLTSSFILNFWKKMMLLLMIFTIVILVFSIELAAAKWKFLPFIPFAIIREFAQNYLLSQLYSFLGDVVLYSTLFYRTLQLSSKSELVDFIISVIFLLAVFLVPVWHYFIILKYRKIKKSWENNKDKAVLKSFQETNKGVKLFYENFHDKSRLQQFFLMFLTLRDLIFSLLLATLENHPLAQILILIAMNAAMIAFLIIKKPFKNIFNFIQQLYYEFLVFLALLVLIIMIGLDMSNSTNDHARDILGKILIIESLFFTYGTLILTTLSIGKMALEFYKEYRTNQNKPVPLPIPTEESPCILPTEENEILSSPKVEDKPSFLEDKNKDTSPSTLPQSESNSPQSKLLKFPTENLANFDTKKRIKLKKSRTSITGYQYQKQENDASSIIEKSHEFEVRIDSSPNTKSPSEMMKTFKFMKYLRKSEI